MVQPGLVKQIKFEWNFACVKLIIYLAIKITLNNKMIWEIRMRNWEKMCQENKSIFLCLENLILYTEIVNAIYQAIAMQWAILTRWQLCTAVSTVFEWSRILSICENSHGLCWNENSIIHTVTVRIRQFPMFLCLNRWNANLHFQNLVQFLYKFGVRHSH